METTIQEAGGAITCYLVNSKGHLELFKGLRPVPASYEVILSVYIMGGQRGSTMQGLKTLKNAAHEILYSCMLVSLVPSLQVAFSTLRSVEGVSHERLRFSVGSNSPALWCYGKPVDVDSTAR